MKKIITLALCLIFSSCTSDGFPFFGNNDSTSHESPEGTYINLQVKLHSTYSLFKALNAGLLSQEEYDELKKDILGL